MTARYFPGDHRQKLLYRDRMSGALETLRWRFELHLPKKFTLNECSREPEYESSKGSIASTCFREYNRLIFILQAGYGIGGAMGKHSGKKHAKKSAVEPPADHTPRKLDKKEYERELFKLQVELVKLQSWVKETGARIVIIFEGRDAAGKGGVIKRIMERVSPRVFRLVALPAPTDREKTQLYWQRYIAQLPAAGEIVIFDRSWYNRAGVEHVMGFCSKEDYNAIPARLSAVRSHAGQQRHHPAEVLDGRFREGAAPPVRWAHQRPVEALEVEPHGSGVASSLV